MSEVLYEVYFNNEMLTFSEKRREEAFALYDKLKEDNKVTCFLYQVTRKELDWNHVEN